MRIALIVILVLLIPALLLAGLWGALALFFQLPFAAPARVAAAVLWALLSLLALWQALGLLVSFTRRRGVAAATAGAAPLGRARRLALPAFAMAWLAFAAWWATILPAQDRVWAPDVAHQALLGVEGDRLIVDNVRAFHWRGETDYDPRWERRVYDLRALTGADLFLSHWTGEAIAHAIVSFTFADAAPLAFSIEIRKRQGQDYSALAGFFKTYEVALIAADERDVIGLRARVRGEDVRLYRLDIQAATARRLLDMYVATSQQLADRPRWYNTLTTNCTTAVFAMSRVIDPGLPLDWRIVASGYVPGYLYEHGFLWQGVPLQELVRASHIGERARAIPDDPDFSRRIREGVPAASLKP